MATLRKAIDVALESLGGPIHKTIIWHMNNRGLFSDPRNIDVESFYLNLKELVGPGADMIIEEVWAELKKDNHQLDNSKMAPVEKIARIFRKGGS